MEKAEHRENRATLGAGLVSVSGVMVLGFPTLDYRITATKSNRKRVNPGNSDARYEVRLHHEIGKGISKRRNASGNTGGTWQSF